MDQPAPSPPPPAAGKLRSNAWIGLLGPCILVLALTLGAVVVYLLGNAQRQRDLQYQEFRDAFNGVLALWVSGHELTFDHELEPILESASARELFASRQIDELGLEMQHNLHHVFALHDVARVRLYDRSGAPLLTLLPGGEIITNERGQDGSQLDEDVRPLSGTQMRISADGRAQLRVIVPWAMGNAETAYIEFVQDELDIAQTLSPWIAVKIFGKPDLVGKKIVGDAVPGALSQIYGANALNATRQLTRLVRTLVSESRLGVTGTVHGECVDVVVISARDHAVLSHNDILVMRNADHRELSIRKSIATALLFALALSALIAFYTARTTTALVNTLSREDAALLLEREERLRAIMDTVADAIVTVSHRGIILSANPAIETLFGYQPDELIGRSFDILMAEDANAETVDILRRIRDLTIWKEARVDGEVTGRRQDGSRIPIELALTCGVINGEDVATVVLRDVTEQKAAKDLLIESVREQKEIQQALRLRSDELVRAARQLSQARDKAEAANAAKSRFLATMSHELRTPMNGILGMIGLLINSPLRADQMTWAHTIKESGDALLTLLNDILDLSKIEAGKLEVHSTLIDPVVVARHTATTWAPLAEAKGLQFRLDVPEEGRNVMGDAVRLRQILTNLVSNAIKFTDSGEICLKVRLRSESPTQARMRFEVSDTGIGIANDKLGLLFQKFSQVDGSLARRHGGSGLGLAICRELAALMGGEVGVETVENVGSVFWVDVPCDIAAGEDWSDVGPAGSRMPVPAQAAESKRLKILVAEDHPVNQSLFRALIDHLGHDLDVVSNGAQAVAALQAARYDVVLLDAHMPVMDGTEAATQIRRLGGDAARTPLIVVTADAMIGDRERYLAAGMDDYVTKPIDLRELAAALSRHAPGERERAERGAATGRAGAAE